MSRSRLLLVFVYTVNAVIVVACIGGGIDLLVKQETGVSGKAQVTGCTGQDTRYTSVECAGTWVVGGSLLGNGRVVVGDVSGAGRGDIGKTIDVRLSGGVAYTRSLTNGLVLLGIGIAWAAICGFIVFQIRRPRRAAKAAAYGKPARAKNELSTT